ncbi:hypothetical protein GM658_25660 [Pseudoduganella eburnea]|uniref:Uncharacterized protein n=1 Tax=Massilia eburnea TaxID=1776165 RepID=A0A6L6QP78_9BURK|nr:hypothetical protein [Massilia eburnea]MTW14005.1 hypothetical protein [Massilia eburnea]
MKQLVAAGSLLVFALTAYADGSGEQKVLIPAAKEVQRHYITPDEFQQYKGAYELSNGKTLWLMRKQTRIYARVDDQSEHEITRTGLGKFTALDGKMDMDLVFAPDESVSGHLSYVDESPAVAGVAPKVIEIQFASR